MTATTPRGGFLRWRPFLRPFVGGVVVPELEGMTVAEARDWWEAAFWTPVTPATGHDAEIVSDWSLTPEPHWGPRGRLLASGDAYLVNPSSGAALTLTGADISYLVTGDGDPLVTGDGDPLYVEN